LFLFCLNWVILKGSRETEEVHVENSRVSEEERAAVQKPHSLLEAARAIRSAESVIENKNGVNYINEKLLTGKNPDKAKLDDEFKQLVNSVIEAK
jgi:hypothetical protein